MESSQSVNYIKFNYSHLKDLRPQEFVSSLPFHALGHEWVIQCYPRGSYKELHGKFTSFIVRLHGKYNIMNIDPTFSCSLTKRDGTASPLPKQVSKRNGKSFFEYAIRKFPSKDQVFAYGDIGRDQLEEFIVDGSFELICSANYNETNICTTEVPKSFNLQSQIGKILENEETADVTFDVENRSFACHRIILAARSPVLKAELFGNMAEAAQKHIRIKDMPPEIFEAMLHFIYTDSFPFFNSQKTSAIMAQHLFVAADRYAIEGLKALCEDQLCASISLDTVTTVFVLAEQHCSHRLKNACLDFIAVPETLINWMLTDEYVGLVRNFPSVKKEIKAKVATLPSFKNSNIHVDVDTIRPTLAPYCPTRTAHPGQGLFSFLKGFFL